MARSIGIPAKECLDLADEYGWSITRRALVQRKETLGVMAAFAGIAILAGSMPALSTMGRLFSDFTALVALYGLLCFVYDVLVMPIYDEDE